MSRGDTIALRKMEHPYLHHLFKCVLLYDARWAKKILRTKLGGRLLNNWELVRSYEEILSYWYPSTWYGDEGNKETAKIKADTVWLLEKQLDNGALGHRLIVHEIKTGKYDLNEIVQKYNFQHFMRRIRYCHNRVLTSNTPLFVWCWSKYTENDLSETTQKLLKKGALRICRLDWILDMLYVV